MLKKITVTLSEKSEKYFNEVAYSLDTGDGKVATNGDVVTLGRWVKDNFHYSGQHVINAKHPAGVFGPSNTGEYVSDLCMQIIDKKAEILFIT